MGSFTSKYKQQQQQPAVNKSTQSQISEIDRAVLDLKNARDRLQRYRNKLQTDSDKLVEQARQAKLKGRTETALGLLRLRKYKLQQATSCEEQLLNVLQMVETIDSKQNEKQLLEALATGKDALKRMHEETSVDDVLNLMDQVQEEIAVENEITEILKGVPTLSAADELAVEQEFEQMQAEMIMENQQQQLPAVPTTKLPEITVTTAPTETLVTAQEQPERVAVPS
jgi:phage shock protein A